MCECARVCVCVCVCFGSGILNLNFIAPVSFAEIFFLYHLWLPVSQGLTYKCCYSDQKKNQKFAYVNNYRGVNAVFCC